MLNNIDVVWEIAKQVTQKIYDTYNVKIYCNVLPANTISYELTIRWQINGLWYELTQPISDEIINSGDINVIISMNIIQIMNTMRNMFADHQIARRNLQTNT